jgi:hypothetical protein
MLENSQDEKLTIEENTAVGLNFYLKKNISLRSLGISVEWRKGMKAFTNP